MEKECTRKTRTRPIIAESPSSSTPQSITSRIFLLYTKSFSSLYCKVSLNILREVANYLWSYPRLLCQFDSTLHMFDIHTHQWHTELQLPFASVITGAVFINDSCAFVTIRRRSQSTFLLREGNQTFLPELEREKYGLVYDVHRGRICVFGGSVTVRCGAQRQCSSEQLSLGGSEWRELPGMQEWRSGFVPCWHKNLVYLCGGWCPFVEIFNPRSDCFSFVHDVMFPWMPFLTVSASCGDEIILLWQKSKTSWNTVTGKVRKWEEFTSPVTPNACVPVRCGEWLYYCDSRMGDCERVDLRTGRKQRVGELEHDREDR